MWPVDSSASQLLRLRMLLGVGHRRLSHPLAVVMRLVPSRKALAIAPNMTDRMTIDCLFPFVLEKPVFAGALLDYRCALG